MKRTRRNHGTPFKAQAALAAVKGDKTLAELAEHFRVHPTQITEWKQQLLAWTADVLGGSNPTEETPDLKTLHAKIGQLALEHDCLEGALTNTRWSICMPLKPSVPPTRVEALPDILQPDQTAPGA